MLKGDYHPKAFLSLKRNVQLGLIARTKILLFLEKGSSNTKEILKESKLSYASVLHHLHLLETDNTLMHKGKRLYVWELTGAGQQRLMNATGT